MKYSFHTLAKDELNNAIDYFEECRTGLGREFLDEIQATIRRIIQYPLAWTKFTENTRRCLTNRFSFGVIYQILDNEILIIAIMQLNREPGYWKTRTKTPN